MNHFDFTGFSVLVVGGVMLDKSLSGSVERLSPEAPSHTRGAPNSRIGRVYA
jgi:bifunctional ADP-heptose synthase (sugar kinase/adenylyltransferase)